MTDENIIKLHPKDYEVLCDAIQNPAPPTDALRQLMAADPNVPIPINLPDGGAGEIIMGDLGFEDMAAAINMRDWLQKACEDKGAKMVGGGFGFGQADIDIELEGCRFTISIRPI